MPQLSIFGWFHLGFFGLLIPMAAVRSRRKVVSGAAPMDRKKHFVSTTIMLLYFGAISLLTATQQRLIGALTAFDRDAVLRTIPVAAALFVAAVAFMRPRWRRAVERRERIVHLFMPANATERTWWIAVSILAGISEEITWRGIQTTLLVLMLSSVSIGFSSNATYLVATMICAVMFGIAHYVQGWRTAFIIALFALAFQLIVFLSHGLLLAMIVHIGYDITAGLTYGRLGKELGYELVPV